MMNLLLRVAALFAIVISAGPLLLGLTTSRVAADEELSVSVVSVDDSDFPTVRLVLTAEQNGTPLDGIASDELTVVESGAPASVQSVERALDASAPLALILALDVSGSVEGETLQQAQAAATSLLESLNPEDAAAVVTFATEVQVVEALSQDRAGAVEAIAALQAEGNTALYDAVAESARLASETDLTRRAVVLLSDGENFGEAAGVSREASIELAAASPALYYVVGVGPNVDRAYLEEVADATGGRFFQAEGAADVPAIYAALEERLRSQFIVTIESAAAAGPDGRSIELTLDSGSASATVATPYGSLQPVPTVAPALPTEVASPAPLPTTAPPVVPVAAEEPSGGGVPLTALALGGVLVLMALAGFYIRVVRPRSGDALGDELPRSTSAAPVSTGAERCRELVAIIPGGDAQRFQLGSSPLTLGSGSASEVRLPNADGIAPEHARLWLRDGKPMLHHVARGYTTLLNDEPVDWASLADGDEVRIGGAVIMVVPPPEVAESEPAAATSGLRGV